MSIYYFTSPTNLRTSYNMVGASILWMTLTMVKDTLENDYHYMDSENTSNVDIEYKKS